MARKIQEIDITDLEEVSSIADEVSRTGEPKRLTRDGKDVAIIARVPNRRRRKTGIIPESDPLISLIGIGRSRAPGGYSTRKCQVQLDAKRSRIMRYDPCASNAMH